MSVVRNISAVVRIPRGISGQYVKSRGSRACRPLTILRWLPGRTYTPGRYRRRPCLDSPRHWSRLDVSLRTIDKARTVFPILPKMG